MGRKPKSTSILLLEKGRLYSDQRDRAEVEPTALQELEPVCPQWFRASEMDSWNYLAEILKNRGIFVDINGPLLEVAALYLAEIRNCHGNVVSAGRNTAEGRNPAIRERNKAAEILIKTLAELNISTTGMARLGSLIVRGKKKDKDEFFED